MRPIGLAVLCLTAAATPADAAGSWKAGAARQVITPRKAVWLAGYGHRTHPAEGKIHDLWVKVLALEDPRGRRAVIVTADLLGFPRVLSEGICRTLGEKFGLRRSQVVLAASHTHSGPVLVESLLDCYPIGAEDLSLIEEYSRGLEEEVVETVGRALSGLGEAELSAGEGTADFAVNRRNNKEAEVPALIARGTALKGPVDHAVPVLAVRAAGGRLLAVLFGYACHNTTLDTYPWCGDYAGFAQIEIEKAHPGTTALFWAGCGADQNPLPRRSVALCEKYGGLLARGVEEALGGAMRPVAPDLRTAFEVVTLDFEKNPTHQDLAAAAATEGIRGRWGRRLLKLLDARKAFEKTYPYPVQVLRLGADQLWIVLGGEVVVDYSLRFKAELGRGTWVAGYANDVMAYIPSRRVWDEGGYESGALHEYGQPADRWTGDVEERIAGSVMRLVRQVRGPLAGGRKDLYRAHPRPGAAAIVSVHSTGTGSGRMEVQGVEARDDVPSELQVRFSEDGGRTWSEFSPLPETLSHPAGVEVWEGSGAKLFDPQTGVLIEVWLRQIHHGATYNNFTYSRVSRDHGRTWSVPRQLRYEEGEEFDPRDPLRPGFFERNQAYFGSDILKLRDGTILHPVAHAGAPDDPEDRRRPWKMGSLCFRGRWDPGAGDYRWTAGKRVSISPRVSSWGLMEPEAAELLDGRILVIWRGSDTPETPGRKWFALSTDGGRSLGEPAELRYDDGSSFYSPSSYHRMVRAGGTGKLFWIGNISSVPPRGNWPRYPLVIAEVDERIPALRKDTVATIDDRGPGQPEEIQFSNFSLLEDREAGELELYLTTYGQDPRDAFGADCWRYRLELDR